MAIERRHRNRRPAGVAKLVRPRSIPGRVPRNRASIRRPKAKPL